MYKNAKAQNSDDFCPPETLKKQIKEYEKNRRQKDFKSEKKYRAWFAKHNFPKTVNASKTNDKLLKKKSQEAFDSEQLPRIKIKYDEPSFY